MAHADLERLWQLADSSPRPKGRSCDGTFGPIGLILQRPPARATYGSTPANTLAFAWTGGDGVHFSFVVSGGAIHEDSPILMSVPMHFACPNLVVGRNLRDFLALGVGCGFFALERLAYEADVFLGGYPTAIEHLDEQLRLIRTAFDVEPWTDPKSRLGELCALEHLLETPAPPPPAKPVPLGAAFWQGLLDRERSRPEHERDLDREAHMAQRLAEELRKQEP